MAEHKMFQSQYSQQAIPAVSQSLQAGFAEDGPFSIWENIQRHPHYPEYWTQVKACVAIHDSAFAHYLALLMDPHASHFIGAVSLSVRHAPPMTMWNDIVRLRYHPMFSSVRSIILAEIERTSVSNFCNPQSARSSDSSYRSAAHSSIRTGASSRQSSRLSSNTDSVIHFEVDENATQKDTPISEIAQFNNSDSPSTTTSARGQRRAPEGKCFICPFRECSGKWFFRRVGDWENHIEKVHGIKQWDDHPIKWLRSDPRPRPVQIVAESPAPAVATTMLRPEIQPTTKRDFKMDEHQTRNTAHPHSVNNPIYEFGMVVPLDTTLQSTGHYGNTGVETFYSDMVFQPITETQGGSYSGDCDGTET